MKTLKRKAIAIDTIKNNFRYFLTHKQTCERENFIKLVKFWMYLENPIPKQLLPIFQNFKDLHFFF